LVRLSDDLSAFARQCVERIIAEALTLRGVELRSTYITPYALYAGQQEFMQVHTADNEVSCDIRFTDQTKRQILTRPLIYRHPVKHADQRGWVKIHVRSEDDLEMTLEYMKEAYQDLMAR